MKTEAWCDVEKKYYSIYLPKKKKIKITKQNNKTGHMKLNSK